MAMFVLKTKKFTNGDMVKAFENEWSSWLGSKHSLFVSSGSTANFLLIASVMEKYNLKRGDKVLLPTCTWMTNVAPIIQLGLEPIFCDINLNNFSFEENDLKRIAKIHPDIKIIFVTHLLGLPANNELYASVFPKAIVLDDVCESHGALSSDGSKVGSDSIGATFSFYFGHHMTTIEGGMVSTNDDELYDIMKMKRSHGLSRESMFSNEYANKFPHIDSSFLFITDGYNFRNHEVCAVLGRGQLKKLDKNIQIRKDNYLMFCELMKSYTDYFYPTEHTDRNSSFCFPLIAKDKEMITKLKDILRKNKIEYRPIVGGNLLSHPFLNKYSVSEGSSNINATTLESNGIYLGNSHFVNKRNINDLRNALNEAIG
jgi:CDP-6-deoxy-D-xylo-4-hexulose-3-dehydrase